MGKKLFCLFILLSLLKIDSKAAEGCYISGNIVYIEIPTAKNGTCDQN